MTSSAVTMLTALVSPDTVATTLAALIHQSEIRVTLRSSLSPALLSGLPQTIVVTDASFDELMSQSSQKVIDVARRSKTNVVTGLETKLSMYQADSKMIFRVQVTFFVLFNLPPQPYTIDYSTASFDYSESGEKVLLKLKRHMSLCSAPTITIWPAISSLVNGRDVSERQILVKMPPFMDPTTFVEPSLKSQVKQISSLGECTRYGFAHTLNSAGSFIYQLLVDHDLSTCSITLASSESEDRSLFFFRVQLIG